MLCASHLAKEKGKIDFTDNLSIHFSIENDTHVMSNPVLTNKCLLEVKCK